MQEKHNVFDREDATLGRQLFERILAEEPPYKVVEFDVDTYKYIANINEIAINEYCESCDCNSVFKEWLANTKILTSLAIDEHNARNEIICGGVGPEYRKKFFKDKRYFLNFILKCAKCGEEHYFSILLQNNTIRKIGQYPSYANKEAHELNKYKNLISKYYPELTRSVNAYSQGMGVAAFVYLRRILEHLVVCRYDGEESLTFVEKLKEVEKKEKIIPEYYNDVKGEIYSILSKGIHEYDEEECIALYPAVRYIIEGILDIELEKKNKKKKAAEAVQIIKDKSKEK